MGDNIFSQLGLPPPPAESDKGSIFAKLGLPEPPPPPPGPGVGTTIADFGKTFMAGALQGTGAFFQGGGELVAGGLNRLGVPEATGLAPFRAENLADPWSKALMQSRSPQSIAAEAGSVPEGNLADPSTWTAGKDPSARGYAMQFANVLGQYFPNLAVSLLSGGAGLGMLGQGVAGGTFGGLQAYGGGAQQEREQIGAMSHDELMQASAAYRDLINAGGDNDANRAHAKQAVVDLAAMGGGLGNGIPSGLENAAETILVNALIKGAPWAKGLFGAFGKSLAGRVATGALGGAVTGGLEESGEQAAQNVGSNLAIGGNRPIGEGTFNQAVFGAMGEGALGGGGGAISARGGHTGGYTITPPAKEPPSSAGVPPWTAAPPAPPGTLTAAASVAEYSGAAGLAAAAQDRIGEAQEFADLAQSEGRDVEFRRAQLEREQQQAAELAPLLQARAEELGHTPEQRLAAASADYDQTPTAMALAFARARQRAAAPTPEAIDALAHEAATSPRNELPAPTPAQIEAGNYKKGHIANFQGLNLSIENPAGSTREGKDEAGRPWKTTLANHYGYIRGAVGADGDHLDAFIGPNPASETVFVVNQRDAAGKFDEHKVMLGFDTREAARQAYLANYDKAAGLRHLGPITPMPMVAFKAWAAEGDKTQPAPLPVLAAPTEAVANAPAPALRATGEANATEAGLPYTAPPAQTLAPVPVETAALDQFVEQNARGRWVMKAPPPETQRLAVVTRLDELNAQAATPPAPVAPPPAAKPEAPAVAAIVKSLQNRDRHSAASATQMAKIAGNPNPNLLMAAPTMADGAPVVTDMADAGLVPAAQVGTTTTVTTNQREIPIRYAVVEADSLSASHHADGSRNAAYATNPKQLVAINNARTAGVIEAYKRGNAAAYRAAIAGAQGVHGVDAGVIAGMKAPVLVRLMNAKDVTDHIGDESNAGLTLGLSATEQAANDAARFDTGAVDFLDDGRPSEAALRGFIAAMPEAERQSLAPDGLPTKQAVDRLMAAVFHAAYGNPELVELMVQSTDPEARNVLTGMGRAAAAMAKLSDAGPLDIRPLVTDAALKLVNAVRAGIGMQKFLAQGDLLGDAAVQKIAEALAANSRSAKTIGELLTDAAAFAYTESQNAGVDIFGETHATTVDDVIRRITHEPASTKNLGEQGGRQAHGNHAQGVAENPSRPSYPQPAAAGRTAPAVEAQAQVVAPAEDFALAGQTAAEVRAESRAVPEEITREQIDREATALFSLTGESQPSRNAVTGGQGGLFTPDGRVSEAAGEARPAAAERRHDLAERKRVEHMTPEELRRELLIDHLTGIGNRRAYEETEKRPVQVSIDADSLKWINDNLGHPAGDESLKIIAQAIRAETDQAFHLSGDEFAIQADTAEESVRIMEAVQKRLDGTILKAELPNGDRVSLTLGVSYGTGKDLGAAERGLQEHKRSREVAGLRAPRGEEPPSATRVARGSGPETQVSGDREEVKPAPEMSAADHLRAAAKLIDTSQKPEESNRSAEPVAESAKNEQVGATDDVIGWDNMPSQARESLAIKAGWVTSKGELNQTGVKIVRRAWGEMPDGTRQTLIRYAADVSPVEAQAAPIPVRIPSISADLAGRAFSGTSMSPERRGESYSEGFRQELTELWQRFEKQYAAAPPDRQAAFVEAFNEIADKYAFMTRAYLAAHSRVMSSFITGPANFPVRSNQRRSETADRRMKEATEYINKAPRRLMRALEGPRDNSVNAAIEAAREDLAKREKNQELYKAINAAIRKKDDAALRALGLSDAMIAEFKKPDFAGRIGVPDYKLTNNRAQIRRLQEHIAELEKRGGEAAQETEAQQQVAPGVRMERNAEAGRLQLFFDGKPAEEVRTALKGAGFRWAPSTGAWQRQLTSNAVAAANQILRDHFGVAPTVAPAAAAPAEIAPTATETAAPAEVAPGAETVPITPTPAVANPAVARLRDMADKLEADANERMNADRLTNTPKRAREAGYAYAHAEADTALARTLRNVADAIEADEAPHLAGVKTRTQVELLDAMVNAAQLDAIRRRFPDNYTKQQEERAKPATAEEMRHAEWPEYTMDPADVRRVADAIESLKGGKMVAARLRRSVAGAEDRRAVPAADAEAAMALISKTPQKNMIGWYWPEVQKQLGRLKSMGITNRAELETALKEFVALRGRKPETDRVKALERKLVGQKVGIDFFPTPKPLAARLADMADIRPGMKVLEPSAGNGNIAEAIRATGTEPVVGEVSSSLREVLEARKFNLVASDFMEHTGEYDRIVMNPPFSNGQDMEHVRHAFDLLKPGGRLVAIVGEGAFFRNDKQATEFRAWLEEQGAQDEKLPEGSFMDRKELATTGTAARIVTIDKPGALYSVAPEPNLAMPQTETPEFKKWFGDSKVVDAEGKPLVVYHGTDEDIAEFDSKKQRRGRWGKGFYFASSPERAKNYGSNVIPVYLRLTTPRNRDVVGDGVIVGSNPSDRVYVVYSPEQIKSAIGNRGTFDPNSANIRYSVAPYGVAPETKLARNDASGVFATRTKLVVEKKQTLGAGRVRSVADAAQALGYLGGGAVERFDALVTDRLGKPLAIVGHFKGAISQTSVYPATVAGEAFRIQGAANIYFAHNHPSGTPELSAADLFLNGNLENVFRGSGIQTHGILAIAGNADQRRIWRSDSGESGTTEAPTRTKAVPVLERVFDQSGRIGDAITSPAAARDIVARIADGQSGFVLIDTQNFPVAFVPVEAEGSDQLRAGGRMDALYRAVSLANAAAGMVVNNGAYNEAQTRNLANFLRGLDMKTLDVLEAKEGHLQSWAEQGQSFGHSPFYSRGGETTGLPLAQVRALVAPIAARWSYGRLEVVQSVADLPVGAAPARTEGVYLSGDRVFLVADNLSGPERVYQVLAHEAIGHMAAEKQPEYRRALAAIPLLERGNAALQAIARRVDATQPGLSPESRAKEILAVAVETGAHRDIGALRRAVAALVAAVKSGLRAMGFDGAWVTRMSEGEIMRMLRTAEAELAGAPRFANDLGQRFSALQAEYFRDNALPSYSAVDVHQQMADLARLAHAEGNENVVVDIAEVPAWETADLQKEVGLDVRGYHHTADLFAVRHAIKQHGDAAKELSRGQLPIADADIAAIPDVVMSPDSLIVGIKNARNQDQVFSIKTQPDGTMLVVEEIRTGRKALALASVRKLPGAKNAKELLPSVLLNARGDTGHVKIIEHPQTTNNAAGMEPRFSVAVAPKWTEGLPADTLAALEKAGVIQQKKTLKERVNELTHDAGKRFVQGVFDQFYPLKELDYRSYLLARMAGSGDAGLEAMMFYGKPFMDEDGAIDINVQADKDGKLHGLIDILQRLQGEQERFFAWMAGMRAAELKKAGKENLFTDDDISALQDLNQGKMADGQSRVAVYQDVHAEFQDYATAILDIAERTHLIDPESRKIWEKDFYVPFYRILEDEGNKVVGPNLAGGGLVNQYAFKQLKGGKAGLNDLMANTLRNWNHLLGASLQNQAAESALKQARLAGAAHWVSNGQYQGRFNPPTQAVKGSVFHLGEVERVIPAGQTYRENGVEKVSDGTATVVAIEQVHYLVDDPLILDAITALDRVDFGGPAMKAMTEFKRALTTGVTAAPVFKVRNLLRDSIAAMGMTELSYNPVRNVVQGVRHGHHGTETVAHMLAGGGLFRFGSMTEDNRAKHVKKLIDSGVAESTILDHPHKVAAMLRKAWDAYLEAGDLSENANRVALYEQLRAQGKSHLEASYEARDLMDFGLRGTWKAVRFLTQVVPFLNARLQGLYKMGRAAHDDPKRMGIVLGAVSLASLALLAAYGDDDDWKKREDWDRDTYWWFKVGGIAYRLPKPFEFGAVGTLVERTAELMSSDEMTGRRFGQRLANMMTQTFSISPVPQMFGPLLDVYANKDNFTGRPIETMGMENLSPENRIGARTTLPAVVAGQLGLWSPVQIDYLMRAYFGWIGSSALTSLDWLASPFANRPARPAMQLRDTFLAGAFMETLPADSSRYVTQFYEQAKEIGQIYADYRQALKQGDIAKAKQIREDHPVQLAQHVAAAGVTQKLTQINQYERFVRASTKMSGETKQETLARTAALKDQLARLVVQRQRQIEAQRR